jgi:hypothetical protein
MPVNKEELAKDLETPEYQKIVSETLAKKDFIVRTKDEETGFLDRFKTDVIEKEIPTRIKAVHDQYDKDIKESFGIDREASEKTYDYLKRAAKTKLDELGGKVKTLEEQVKKGDPTGAYQKQLEEAEKKYQSELAKKDQELGEYRNKLTTTEKRSAIENVYAGIKSQFKKELPAFFARTERSLLDEALASSKVEEIGGKQVLVMTNADGSTKKDGQFNPITVESFLRAELKDVLDDKPGAGGAGSKGAPDKNKGIDPSKITLETFTMPETLKSRGELMDYMLELGLKRGTKIFDEIWTKHSKDLKALI